MAEFTLGHRRSLDGVRGLAITFVLLSHVPSLSLQGGFIGVDLFFVLSGFLITTLLLEEERTTGGIRLRSFYARRALRLLPALVAVLLVAVALSARADPPDAAAKMRTSALITLLYSSNWFCAWRAFPTPELTPTWSLSVEEQFYLVWPVLLVALRKARASAGAIAGVAAGGLLLSAAWRAWMWRTTGSFERAFFGTDVHSDGLLAGVLVAALVWGGMLRPGPGVERALNWGAHLTLGLLFLFVRLGWEGDGYVLTGGLLVLNLGMAVLVASLLFGPGPLTRSLFEFPPLVWLGRVSYGVYLWHMITFGMGSRLRLPGALASWPVMIALTVAVAAASYAVLERPLLKLKRRFERVPAPAPRTR